MFDLLSGTKIIDLTSIVLGPYATQTLGDMGADVIKVEPPGGDLFRASSYSRTPSMAPGFMNCNRNKRSLAVDLKSDAGREVLLKLVREADVFVHNMRPSAAKRLGLSYEALKQENPQLVYCTAPGYGQEGPYANYPAYDDVIQAMSGIAALNASENDEPRFFPSILCDKIGGLHLALAVTGGLLRRSHSSEGCYIEAPMFESILSFLYVEHLAGLSFNPPEGTSGYHRITNPYRKPYRTKDGYIAALPYDGRHWARFFRIADRDDLAEQPWLADADERAKKIPELYQTLEKLMPQKTSDEWLDALKEADIPCAPVQNLDGLLNDPHLKEIGFFQEYDHPTEGPLRMTRSPFVTQGVGEKSDILAPKIGQDSRDILASLGYGEDIVQGMIDDGVVKAG